MVCQSKEAAIRYKKYLDEINIVSSDVVISPPDDREGEESAYGTTSDLVKSFWKKMMDEHGNYDRYQKHIISRFEKSEDPEIIIVVDKLLTGFDVPINTVLYLTRRLQGHTLLQAIARVNRICEGKDYGYIVDYYGVLGSLEEALETYSSFDEFDPEDLMGTFTDITTEIALLPQKHADLLDLFKEIKNKRDAEAYQVLLRDEAIRQEFYNRLSVYARILKLALSSIEFHQKTDDKKLEQYKEDLASFVKIRNAVIQRYSDAIDYKQYEGQIQKLIDTHVTTEKVVPITDLVNIFDKEAFQDEVEKTIGTVAKADKIASRTSKHISEKMDEDPAFYKKFSELLKETIREYEEGRISDLEYLEKVKELQEKVLSRTDSDIPSELVDRSEARAFYGIALQGLENKSKSQQEMKDWAVEIALFSEETIKNLIEVDWTNKIDITKKMLLRIGDFLIDEIRDKYQISLSFEEIDHIAEQIIENAKLRFK
ncbi:MAG: UvrB domain 3-containing protein [Fluviicola sp.]